MEKFLLLVFPPQQQNERAFGRARDLRGSLSLPYLRRLLARSMRSLRQSRLACYLREISGRNYNPDQYWTTQLGHFGSDLRGPGKGGLSEQENAELYRQGEQTLQMLMRKLDINWDGYFAEIGPGNGYWLNWLTRCGVKNYAGFDITDRLFSLLREQWPHASLIQLDVTRSHLPTQFDVVLMLDVSQHILDERAFRRAMDHCADAVKPGGHFIVTSWLQPYRQVSSMEVVRSLKYYASHFHRWKFVGPLVFRDKFVMAFTAPQTQSILFRGRIFPHPWRDGATLLMLAGLLLLTAYMIQ